MSLTTSVTWTTDSPFTTPSRKSSKSASFIRVHPPRHNCYVVCQHTEDSVTFPDGTRVLASGWFERKTGEPTSDFGLYLDPQWTPHWPCVLLDWPDFGVPLDASRARREIRLAFERARAGDRVELPCVGGHGRTRESLGVGR